MPHVRRSKFVISFLLPYMYLSLCLYRETKEGAIIALVITGYLGFQQFSRLRNLQKSSEQGSIIATLAIISIAIIPCLYFV